MEVETKGKDPNSRSSDNGEVKLGGDIILMGFSLDPAEMIVVKKIVGHYANKIGEKTSYNEIKVRLRQHQKNKSFLHEITAHISTNKGELISNIEDKNLYSALSGALDKVYNQVENKG